MILTNPPFGGEEERGIQANFPEDKQTAETALLFLQLIMRKLRRPVGGGKAAAGAAWSCPTARCSAMACARASRRNCSRNSTSTPSSACPTACSRPTPASRRTFLFFDRSGPTKEVWYYEQPLPEGRKNYTKTAPIQFEEFYPCLAWWNKREENDHAWKVPAAELLANGCNLDRKNPRAKEDITHLPPEHLAESILRKEQRIAEIMMNIRKLLR